MYATDRRHTDRRQRKASLNASALWHNTVTIYWLAVFPKMSLYKLSFASERKQAAERAHNFVDFYLQTTSTVSEVSRCRSPFRSLPSSPIRRTLTQMRCQTVAVNLRWYRSLWALTILAVESPTNLFVASHWLERSSCRFVVTLLVFSRADYSILQVLTTSHVVFISTFYWRLASKASIITFPLIGSPAVTSHAAVNSDARSIQIFSQNIRLRC